MNDVKQGRWDLVLRTVSQLTLPPSKLYDLYEQASQINHHFYRSSFKYRLSWS
jgi:hypothetical protein